MILLLSALLCLLLSLLLQGNAAGNLCGTISCQSRNLIRVQTPFCPRVQGWREREGRMARKGIRANATRLFTNRLPVIRVSRLDSH